MFYFKYKWPAVYFLILAVLIGCSRANPAEKPSGLSGAELATTYCGNCHQLPPPSLLPKAVWEKGVLPVMGLRLGFLSDTMDVYRQDAQIRQYQQGVQLGVYPSQPVLHRDDWLKIVRHYIDNAPEELPAQARQKTPESGSSLFRLRMIPGITPLVTALAFDSVRQRALVGTRLGTLLTLDKNLKKVDSVGYGSAVAGLYVRPKKPLDVLTMGIMDPNDDSSGSMGALKKLHRPVHTSFADLNRDGREDIVVCQFGYLTGKLTWHEATAAGFREHTLSALPGARITHIRDVDRDGWPDVVALLAQGDEQVALFRNKRNGTFVQETLLRFPPVYGSSYVELADMDADGDEDIIYTNGDNADYSYALKPYHGIRIFVNDGSYHFREGWFYPLYGATQTIARDFDNDGAVDIAAIAHFPDFGRKQEQSLIIFKNIKKLSFISTIFDGSNRGHWLTMQAADYDADGDIDLLLGAFKMAVTPVPIDLRETWAKTSGLWVLENQYR